LALYAFSASSINALAHLLSQNTYTLTANAQIWPRTLNGYIGGSNNYIYLVIRGHIGDLGIQFILGYAFLERFYTAYYTTDTTHRYIGIATTPWTTATTN